MLFLSQEYFKPCNQLDLLGSVADQSRRFSRIFGTSVWMDSLNILQWSPKLFFHLPLLVSQADLHKGFHSDKQDILQTIQSSHQLSFQKLSVIYIEGKTEWATTFNFFNDPNKPCKISHKLFLWGLFWQQSLSSHCHRGLQPVVKNCHENGSGRQLGGLQSS